MNDSAYARSQLSQLKPIHPPGLIHLYHGVTWGPLIREIVSAATGRGIREILATEILDPLGFRWTNYGVTERDVPLVAPNHVTGKPLPAPIAKAFRAAVGGTMAQIIPSPTPHFSSRAWCRRQAPCPTPTSCLGSPKCSAAEGNSMAYGSCARHRAAVRECRRMRPDIATGLAPMRWGTGYMLGSRRFGPFGRDTSAAFGHTGLTNVAMWADPSRRLSVGFGQQRKARPSPRSNAIHRVAGPDIRGNPANTVRWNCVAHRAGLASWTMADSLLQQQLDEVRELLARARALFGGDPIAPPDSITPKPQPPQ